MRTTIEIPDSLLRRTKSLAAARGITLKQLIVNSLEREVELVRPGPAGKQRRPLPLIHLEPGRTIDLTTFHFDALLS
jgi:hypothetical protein